jgi:2-polyprenyl-3-methyl-5-hydroxy-6-metoxy-1,4-benzoquinol methylase
MSSEFRRHDVEWTPETIARFWDWLSTFPPETYFSHHSGAAILDFVARYVRLDGGRVLDYGCGAGYLIEHLLGRGVRVHGLDFSSGSVERVRARFGSRPNFDGATHVADLPGPLPAESFDVVTCIEVIEHLPDVWLRSTLLELSRLLRPGGTLLVTTPNDERLDANRTMCPECGGVFHAYQHVRSWTAATLEPVLAAYGIQKVHVEALNFSDVSPSLLRRMARRLRGQAPARPHLAFIGRKG